MDIFVGALETGRDFFRDAALIAFHELELFEALLSPMSLESLVSTTHLEAHHLRALLDVGRSEGWVVEEAGVYSIAEVPAAPKSHPTAGWGKIAEAFRANKPQALFETPGALEAYQNHLFDLSSPVADELVVRCVEPCERVLDVGSGYGAYGLAALHGFKKARVTLVDEAAVLASGANVQESYGERVERVAVRAEEMTFDPIYDTVLVANLLHLHGPDRNRAILARCACALRPGGRLIVLDLDPAKEPTLAAYFSLNMAIYTELGRVYDVETVSGWLREVGLEELRVERLIRAPSSYVIVGR